MGSQQVFCLRWSNHQSNMLSVFDELLQQETLVDVTLACEGLSMKAHKVVLSACSPYFQTLFVQNPCKHPIVILKDIKYSELKALIDFMYKGEVNVTQEQLSALLKTAEALKIKGLTEVTGGVNGQQERGGAGSISGGLAPVAPEPLELDRPRHQHHRRGGGGNGGGLAHHSSLSGARVERTLQRAAASTASTSLSPPQNLSTVDRRPQALSTPPPQLPFLTAAHQQQQQHHQHRPHLQGTPPPASSLLMGSSGLAQYLLPAHQRATSTSEPRAPSYKDSSPPQQQQQQQQQPPPPQLQQSRTPPPLSKRKRTRHHHHQHRRRPSSSEGGGGGGHQSDAEDAPEESLEVQGSPEMLETKVEVVEEEFEAAGGGRLSDDEDEPMDQPSGADTDSNQESLDNFYTSQGPSNPPSEDYMPIGEPMPAMPISLATPLSLLQKLKSPGPSTSSGMASQAELKYFEQSLLEFTAQAAASASDNTCPVCGITFRYRNNLYRHRRTHCDTRVRHGCQVCGKTFSRKDTLQLHARVKHQGGEHLYPVADGSNSYEDLKLDGEDCFSKLPDDYPKQLDLTTKRLDLSKKSDHHHQQHKQLDLTVAAAANKRDEFAKKLGLTGKGVDHHHLTAAKLDSSSKQPDDSLIDDDDDDELDVPEDLVTTKKEPDDSPQKLDSKAADEDNDDSDRELDLTKRDDELVIDEDEGEEDEVPENLAGERK